MNMKFTATPGMSDIEKTNVWWANQVQMKNSEIAQLKAELAIERNGYHLDLDNLTIENKDSNGVKDIVGLDYAPIGNPAVNVPHVVYANDDQRYWFQPITSAEFVAVEIALVEPAHTAADYGLGEGGTL